MHETDKYRQLDWLFFSIRRRSLKNLTAMILSTFCCTFFSFPPKFLFPLYYVRLAMTDRLEKENNDYVLTNDEVEGRVNSMTASINVILQFFRYDDMNNLQY